MRDEFCSPEFTQWMENELAYIEREKLLEKKEYVGEANLSYVLTLMEEEARVRAWIKRPRDLRLTLSLMEYWMILAVRLGGNSTLAHTKAIVDCVRCEQEYLDALEKDMTLFRHGEQTFYDALSFSTFNECLIQGLRLLSRVGQRLSARGYLRKVALSRV